MMNLDQELGSAMSQDPAGAWNESDSEAFLDFGRVLTPARHEIARTFLDLIPAEQDEAFLFVDIGTGQGWLSEALLRHFRAARVIALDGSDTMLRHAGETLAPFSDRVELGRFLLEDPDWPGRLEDGVRCFISSLVIHHLDDSEKRALYGALYQRLEAGGGLLIADLIAPASEWERRHMARAWDDVVRRQSLDELGDLRAYEFFVQSHWNLYDYPDPMDMPSPVLDQLRWLEEAGFTGASVFWSQAGHALFGGYKGSVP